MTPDHNPHDLRAGIVGAGLMGRWHATAAARAGAKVVVVFDPDGERAAALAKRFGATAADTIDAALQLCNVVHICSPVATHYAHSMAAFARDCAVICEKPVADTTDLTTALVKEAARRQCLFVPTHQFLFQRGFQKAMRVLPTLGALRHIDVTICTAGAAGMSPAQSEEVARSILPHPFSLIERIRPGMLDGVEWVDTGMSAGEVRLTASDKDLTLNILISCAGRPPVNQLRLIADRGTVSVDLFHGFATTVRGLPSPWQKIRQPFAIAATVFAAATANLTRRLVAREWAYPGLRSLVDTAYSAVRNGGASPISANEIISVARACEQIGERRTSGVMPSVHPGM